MPNNLFSNLLVVIVLFALFAIVYCKVKNLTLTELYKEIIGIFEEKTNE